MKVTVSVIRNGIVEDRPPTEDELQEMAERYFIALLKLSFPGAEVRIKRRKPL